VTNWFSQTQRSTTLSSTEAEYCALATGAQDVVFQSTLLEEIIEQSQVTINFAGRQYWSNLFGEESTSGAQNKAYRCEAPFPEGVA